MTFLSMLIALSLHQLLPGDATRPGDAQLRAWERWVADRIDTDDLRVVVVILVPAVLLYWLLGALHGWLFGLPSLLAVAAALLWSLGREDYHTALARYAAHREAGDSEAAWLALQPLWCPGSLDDSAQEGEALARCETQLLYCGYQRWFAPLFYFLLLGPVAAVVYRLVFLFAASGQRRYGDLLGWLDWVPARLLALSFAVTGDFVAVARASRPGSIDPAPALLRRAALASAGGELSAATLRDLLYRTAGLWLLVAAVLIIVL